MLNDIKQIEKDKQQLDIKLAAGLLTVEVYTQRMCMLGHKLLDDAEILIKRMLDTTTKFQKERLAKEGN
jgi:hypothetical protein